MYGIMWNLQYILSYCMTSSSNGTFLSYNLFFPGRSTTTCVSLAFWRALVSWALKASSCLLFVCYWRRHWWRALYPTCATVHWNTSSSRSAYTLRDVPCSASPSATTSRPSTSSGGHPKRNASQPLSLQGQEWGKMRWWRKVWPKSGHPERAGIIWREKRRTQRRGKLESGKWQKGLKCYKRVEGGSI